MAFCDLLNLYCEEIGCTNVQLATASGVDASTISRLRNKSRATKSNHQLVDKLSAGLILLAREANVFENPSKIEGELKSALIEEEEQTKKIDYNLSVNFNTILEELEISNIKLAKYLSVDASWISRTRKGERRPTSRENFMNNFLEYLIKYYFEESHKKFYKTLIGEFPEEISHRVFKIRMEEWFVGDHFNQRDSVNGFLEKLDHFHLEEFLASKKILDLKIPTVPINLQIFKRFCGLEQIRKGMLEFFKAVIFSKKTGNILLYTNIDYEKLTKDDSFRKKIMFGLAMVLKKGNQIHVIHHLDRSFRELILGIESWIPLYMTGQIEPYYFPQKTSRDFKFGLFLAPSIASFSMECIAQTVDLGIGTLTRKPEELTYYEALGKQMLSTAQPLMKIYRHTAEDKYMEELDKELKINGNWRNLFQGPPIYTMNEAMFRIILNRSVMNEGKRQKLVMQYKKLCIMARNVLKENRVTDIFPIYNEEEFKKNPLSLQLVGLFSEEDLFYTYEEYKMHIDMVKEYARKIENYFCNILNKTNYKNINILIHEGGSTIVAKNKQPVIAFFIKHPQLCKVFQEFELSTT